MDTLVSMKEVSKRIGVAVPTLRDWRKQNRGPVSALIGHRVMYRETDVQAWVTEQFEKAATG